MIALVGNLKLSKHKGSGGALTVVPMARPRLDKPFEWVPQNYSVSIDLFPNIAMIRDNALKLATQLSDRNLELTDIHMSDEQWEFIRPQPKQGQTGARIRLSVQEQVVELEHTFPSAGLERFERLVDQVIESIEKVATPGVLLSSMVSLQYQVDMESDARKAVIGPLELVEGEEDGKLAVFGRPCSFFGLRLGFPPYLLEGTSNEAEEGAGEGALANVESGGIKSGVSEERGEEWQATLTLQSLTNSPNSLSVEVSGQWMHPIFWKGIQKVLNDRVQVVDRFLKTKTGGFLKHIRGEP